MDQQAIDKSYKEIDFPNLQAALESETASFVVFFGGSGCHFCEKLKPIYDRLALKHGKVFDFYYIDAYQSENSEGCADFLDGGVPTLYVFWKRHSDLIPYAPTQRGTFGYAEPYLNKYFNRYIEIISSWEE